MDKYAFITGGTRGIGKAVASCLAQSGYHLLLTYGKDDDRAQAVAACLQAQYNINVYTLRADISTRSAVGDIIRYISTHSLRIDAAVFNAGLTCREPFGSMDEAEWERVFFANVHFPVFLLQRLVDYMNGGGSVVFTGSLMGIEPHATSLSYGVTKAAVHALTKNLVKFLTPYRIRVNAVAPGFVDTDWQKGKPEAIRRSIESKIALGRFCDPDELAGVYKMLIENSYFNGEVIVADGGYSYK
ncbi:MAG: SDR family oxidoreductase [Tannerella sp.]|jgi:3-oxoacyl-[acyl-carrier protein] reductase|nr:SDR family oxidoreductase [Tannerella sp.]